ncbi:hypothetical protein GCM10025865_08090 [Paraoerskovia sediminicola]|uniref:HTH cro/C1-type domain-containing protein n=1 Tax=Paraoerskovia sediminicola TaxID=1138587 RepID=A0ABN6XA08_9CELL|nr:helix-turn-helix domain-containing protein [Paraoerskovia sediminicola]BDZ41510.1 hypothetical protein GCM10025865_08090 [Paraoerskovia sediminicola]
MNTPRATAPPRAGASLDSTVVSLGARIRDLRRAQGTTLVELAAETGLSHSFISQVERGLARLSMSSLFRVAQALGTTQHELLAGDAPASGGAHTIVRRTEDSPASVGDGGVRALAHGASYTFVPLEFSGSSTDLGEYWAHDEGEFAYVVLGNVVIDLDGAVEVLAPGDSTFYAGGVGHRWASADGEPYRVLVVKERSPRDAP